MKSLRFGSFWHTLTTLVGGASLGLALAWLVSRDRSRGAPVVRAPSAEGSERALGRWSSAVDSLRGERLRAPRAPDLDLDGLRVALASIPGTEQIHLRHLGGGIVEALGAAPDPATVHQVLTVLRMGAGVTVVVNRIWTPASAHAKKPDLSHIPRTRRDTSVN
jgi:hypothetical protein